MRVARFTTASRHERSSGPTRLAQRLALPDAETGVRAKDIRTSQHFFASTKLAKRGPVETGLQAVGPIVASVEIPICLVPKIGRSLAGWACPHAVPEFAFLRFSSLGMQAKTPSTLVTLAGAFAYLPR